ncbi:hypothetical protein EB118_03220 [bacterium]|nr:hypothetical protein [bacterium]
MNLTRQMKDMENVYSEKVTFPPKGTFELAKDAKVNVMGHQDDAEDAADLGLDVGAGDAGAEVSAEGDVTFTLPRDVAQKLHDVLMTALEAGKEEGEKEDAEDAEHKDEEKHEGEESEEDEDNQEVAGEATELTAVPDSKGLALTGKNNKVGDETAKLVTKGEGDGKIKDGADGKLHPQKEVGATSPKGKANVVAGKASNVGHYLFQK